MIINAVINFVLKGWYYFRYLREYWTFGRKLKSLKSGKSSEVKIFPCLYDKTKTTSFDHHYVYHPAWATRIIRRINPSYHVDISSTLNFSSQISSYLPVFFFDYRPPVLKLSQLFIGSLDLKYLPFKNDSVQSLSCMHTLEHIGLGRYGDELDPEGDIKSTKELERVIKRGGNLLIVVPVGEKNVIQFNAHRIYSFNQVLQLFPSLTLKRFSFIPDDPNLENYIDEASEEDTWSSEYGCGCFWFIKDSIECEEQ